MTNDDLLQQFDKLIQKRLEENNKQQRQEIKADIKAAVDPLHERLDVQQERFTTLEKNLSGQINAVKTELSEKISHQSHEVADILAKAVMPDIDRHEAQIEELQKAVGLRPKH